MRLLCLLPLALTLASGTSSQVKNDIIKPTASLRRTLSYRGGGKEAKPQPETKVRSPVAVPPTGLAASIQAFSIITAAGASLALYRDKRVISWFSDLKPLHKYVPLSRHQVLIFLAWLMNQIAVRVPGRSDGKSWKETTSIRFFTPSGYAFAIWAPIFLGEFILNFYQLGSKYLTTNLQPYLAKLAPPLAQAFTAQSLWCLAFRPWVGRMQFVPSALLALTALGLSRVHSILRQAVNAGVMKPWDYLIVHLPLSLHFGWITCATLVNLNGWFAVAPLRTGDKLGLALASVNVAVTLGSKISIASGDPVISFVVAWALYAVAHDLQPGNSMLRKNKMVGDDALDCLEISARVSAGLQAGLSALLIIWKAIVKTGLAKPGDGEKLVKAGIKPIMALFK